MPVLANKIELFIHSTTRNDPYKHLSHDSIFKLWRTFWNEITNKYFAPRRRDIIAHGKRITHTHQKNTIRKVISSLFYQQHNQT